MSYYLQEIRVDLEAIMVDCGIEFPSGLVGMFDHDTRISITGRRGESEAYSSDTPSGMADKAIEHAKKFLRMTTEEATFLRRNLIVRMAKEIERAIEAATREDQEEMEGERV
jgi:hypothetical protein